MPSFAQEIGKQLWFFPSPVANDPNCLLLAHGGWNNACGHFNAPANTSVHFFCADGATLSGGTGFYDISHTQMHLPAEDVAPGGLCKNYALFKGLGKRSPSAKWKTSYHDVQRELNDAYDDLNRVTAGSAKPTMAGFNRWCPNFVSVRHRSVYSKQILLEDLIHAVQNAEPHVLHFHIAACRA